LGSCDLLKENGSVGGALRGLIVGAKYMKKTFEFAERGVRHGATGAIKSCHYSDDLFEVKAFSYND